MRKLYYSFFILLIFSCGTADDEKELSEVVEIAQTIEKDFNNYYSKNILNLFSPTRLAMRLGREFYDIPRMERQFIYSFLRDQFETSTYNFMENLDQKNQVLSLFDVHKEGEVYRANYEIYDKDQEGVRDFVVIYIEKNNKGQWKIVNQYSLENGFSLGQIFKDVFKYVQDQSTSSQMLQYESQEIIQGANQLFVEGAYEKAFDSLKTASPKMLNRPGVAILGVRFASKVSDELYMNELHNMKNITPNDQSKIFYDCVIENIQNEGDTQCIDTIREALMKS
ncbi:MAG: hypothetical protein WBG46_00465 [Nonlabens sp.]